VSLLELVDSVLGSFAEELDGRGIQWEVRSEGDCRASCSTRG
jgi:two-component system OmpR family sensor kinase